MSNLVSIDLIDTAILCGIDIKRDTLEENEVQARCPYCRDYKYRMYLCSDPQRPVFWCHNCGTGGNAVSLYADFNPSGVALTAKESWRQLINHPAVRTGELAYRQEPVPKRIKPLDERSKIYLELLKQLQLEPAHKQNLHSRGLTDEIIDGNMYRSIPTNWRFRQNVVDKLAARFDLSDMPGFYTKGVQWRLAGCRNSGILIPVCDSNNRIQSLQIRLDFPQEQSIEMPDGSVVVKNGGRFRTLSSAGKFYTNGTGTSSFIHVVGDLNSSTIYLTEGPMKADIASFLSGGHLFIGLTGVQNTQYLECVIKQLQPAEIVECIDMDVRTNPDVQRAQARIRSICMPLCVHYITFQWPSEEKGIDDYLLYQRLKEEYLSSAA